VQLYNELRLAKRALFHRELAYRDQPLGSVYPPQEHTYWQKECGEYKHMYGAVIAIAKNKESLDGH